MSFFRIKKIHRYIFKEVFGPFIFGVLAFSAIISGGALIPGLVGDAAQYGLSIDKVLALFCLRVPEIITYIFPMSVLLATLLAFGRMSGDSEITAFRSGGISLYKLMIAPIFIGFVISVFTIYVNEVIVPEASFIEENLILQLKDLSKNKLNIKENVNIPQYKDGYLNRLVYARSMEDGEMKEVSIAEYNKGRLERIIFADTAIWEEGGGWIFRDGLVHQFSNQDRKSVLMIEFKEEKINIAINPRDVSGRGKDPAQLNFSELLEFINKQKSFGNDVCEHQVRLNQKMSIPFASLIFVFFGIPLGLRPQRSSSSVGMGISIIVIFFYYILLSLGMWLGLQSVLSPFLAAWLPNIIIGFYGFYLMVKKANL